MLKMCMLRMEKQSVKATRKWFTLQHQTTFSNWGQTSPTCRPSAKDWKNFIFNTSRSEDEEEHIVDVIVNIVVEVDEEADDSNIEEADEEVDVSRENEISKTLYEGLNSNDLTVSSNRIYDVNCISNSYNFLGPDKSETVDNFNCINTKLHVTYNNKTTTTVTLDKCNTVYNSDLDVTLNTQPRL